VQVIQDGTDIQYEEELELEDTDQLEMEEDNEDYTLSESM
jgi:hypothetical protein